MSSFKYSRYISHVARHPFAILPEKFMVITELFQQRAAGAKFTDEEIAERLAADPSRDRQAVNSTGGAIAVIPVHGVIAHRADSFEASSGGTSTELIGRALSRAVADDSISAVLLDFDTPGGSVEGVPELAAKIAKWTAFKPIVGHINALCASAGYWLGSQCTELFITPSGLAGSIGVFLVLVDETEALAKAGVKVNAISAGDYKLEGAPWEPLTDEGRAHLQGQVDVVYRDFLGAVAKGRGITLAAVKENYGKGRVFDAKESLARGMVDGIATVEATLARMMSGKVGSGRKMAAVSVVVEGGPVAVAGAPGILLPGIPGHSHAIGADGQPTCGCTYGVTHIDAAGETKADPPAAAEPAAIEPDPAIAQDRDALDLAAAQTE